MTRPPVGKVSSPRRVEISSAGQVIRALYYLPANASPRPQLPPRGRSGSALQRLPAVLISHGALGCKEQFQALAEHLLWAGFAVLTLDMRGHGESGGKRHHIVIADWQNDLDAACQWLCCQPEIDGERIGGFGFSSGGSAMLETAALPSQKLRAVVTLAATVQSVLSPLETRVFRMLGGIGALKRRWFGKDLHLPLYPLARLTPAALDPAVNAAVMDDPQVRAGYWRYPLPGAMDSLIIDTLDRVGNIQVPVCVLHGEDDRVDSPASAHALFRALTGPKALHLVPRSGHMAHLDQSRGRVFTLAGQWFQRWLG